jgi:uncharacterized iron-regulated membrane protein
LIFILNLPTTLVPAKQTISHKLHSSIGLLFGSAFVILGLTGALIVWINELDRMLNPDLLQVRPPPGMMVGAPLAVDSAQVQKLTEILSAESRYGRPSRLIFPEHAGDVVVAWYPPKAGMSDSMLTLDVVRQIMIDPATLSITGERNWGELGVSRRLLMPTLFHLHRYLIAGKIGKTIVGISGLVLLITAISGLILWWPKWNRKALRQALSISFGGSWARLNFRLHRTAGFFAAPVLMTLGFSGSYFNFPEVIVPIVSTVSKVNASNKLNNQSVAVATLISPKQAIQIAQALYPLARISRLSLPANSADPYEVRLRQPSEVRQGDGATRIIIDAGDGRVLRIRDPLRASAGDVFLDWQFPLHNGEAFGIAGRIFVSCFGVLPLLFFVTGLTMWRRRLFRH